MDFVIHKTKNMKYTTHMQNFHIIIVCQVWNNERIKKLTNKENVLKPQKLASTNERPFTVFVKSVEIVSLTYLFRFFFL